MLFVLAQAAEAVQAASQQRPPGISGWLVFSIIVGILTVPFLVGAALGNLLRLKEFSGRIGTVLFALTAGATPFVFELSYYPEKEFKDCFRLGIDLAGGTNLVYQIDHKAAATLDKDINRSMDNMVGAISRRINPSGAEDVTVRRVGQERIEIIIPGADQAYVEEMKDRVRRVGTLEFQILATDNLQEHRSFIRKAQALQEDVDIVLEGGVQVARWADIAEGESIERGGGETLPAIFRKVKRGEQEIDQVLLAVTPPKQSVTGEFLVEAMEQIDSRSGGLAVGFTFNDRGATRFYELTRKYQPLKDGSKYRLAILLDGKVKSAPRLNEPISGQGQITGNFTHAEVKSLVDVLNAGALDIPLDPTPVSEFTISPLLGLDVRTKGIRASLVSAVLIFLFLALYYLKAGLVAVVCMSINLFLTVATMVFVQGAFTLPGLAGMALSIGMSVDANVLIYERMREEIAKGASPRLTIHNGFDKAFSAIFDGNFTSLIASVILYMVGTDQVKGFALTLFIGVSMSMFSALYVGRLIFELMERKGLLKKIVMLKSFPTPNFDFMGKQKYAFTLSAIMIAVGIGSFFIRGAENFDIDFRGGTMVTFEFQEPKSLADFRAQLEEKFGTSISLERLTLEDEAQTADVGRRWRLRTVDADQNAVEKGISEALGPIGLRKVTMKLGELQAIASEDAAESKEDAEKAPPAKSSPYAGGHETTLSFSEEITPVTASQALINAIKQLPDAGSKYPEPQLLFELVGVKGTGLKVATGQVRKFDELKLQVRKELAKDDLDAALTSMQKQLDSTPLFEEVTNFASAVGVETQRQALVALALSIFSIIIYIWFRFESLPFGLAAVIPLFHDVLIAAGALPVAAMLSDTPIGAVLGLEDFKINLTIVAALLTIIGFSINDTIVIFDRVREVRGKNPALTSDMLNLSLNQTFSRTLLTSSNVVISVVVLYIMGGESIHAFSFCLLIGFGCGVYTTLFLASPLLLWILERQKKPAKTTRREVATAKS